MKPLESCMIVVHIIYFHIMCPKSALVSGFNIEYGLGSHAFLFISEYACIIFLSWTTCLLVCLYGISLAAQLLRMFSQRDNATEQFLKGG